MTEADIIERGAEAAWRSTHGKDPGRRYDYFAELPPVTQAGWRHLAKEVIKAVDDARSMMEMMR